MSASDVLIVPTEINVWILLLIADMHVLIL
jgi:hypothetical protein